MKLFDRSGDIAIVLSPDAPEAVFLAAKDLQRDLRRISGQAGFPIIHKHCDRCIRILPASGGEPEGYTVTVDEQGICVAGADTLGTVYGVYAISTRLLGVLPVHLWIDRFPETREQMHLSPQVLQSHPKAVRLRGWFINDEDLLTDFKRSGGKRHIDYQWYGNVMDISVLDMALETALRLEINLVIPASFVDILNPPEAALVDQVCRRGLYISQHHIEPVGVSFFAAENYLKAHGLESEPVSFVNNRSRMEEIWHTYIQKWATYGHQVVWQLGLRGKGDRAVWQHDPNVPDDSASRGGIISDAIATQHRMIAETLGTTDFFSTSTLWMEGAQLYASGHLYFPESTIVVLSDIGFSQMFGDDFFTAPRKPGIRHGIYYHIAYWHSGPHLAEGTDPGRMAYSYRLAQEKDSLFYSILNVSNIRPLHASAWLNAELLRDPGHFDPDAVLDQLMDPSEKALWWEYFSCIADLGSQELKNWCIRHLFHYHDHGKLPFPEFPVQDAFLRTVGRYWLRGLLLPRSNTSHIYSCLRENLSKWIVFSEKLQNVTSLYAKQFLRYPSIYMREMTRWACAAYEIVNEIDPEAARQTGIHALQTILQERTILEQGPWAHWHRGDTKVNIPELLSITDGTFII